MMPQPESGRRDTRLQVSIEDLRLQLEFVEGPGVDMDNTQILEFLRQCEADEIISGEHDLGLL